MKTHKQRAEKIQNAINANKLFTFIVIIISVVLIANFVYQRFNNNSAESVYISEVDTNINEENQKLEFYWSDLWVLAVGGGFCVIKIIQEKRKAKEKL